MKGKINNINNSEPSPLLLEVLKCREAAYYARQLYFEKLAEYQKAKADRAIGVRVEQ